MNLNSCKLINLTFYYGKKDLKEDNKNKYDNLYFHSLTEDSQLINSDNILRVVSSEMVYYYGVLDGRESYAKGHAASIITIKATELILREKNSDGESRVRRVKESPEEILRLIQSPDLVVYNGTSKHSTNDFPKEIKIKEE